MKQYDIEYCKLDSGAIRLMQDAYGSDDAVDLHPMQLRAIVEHFGLVAPQPPADELTKRLAEQLCAAYLALLDEQRYWSPGLERIWERLDAQIDCLPSELFPHHLWDQHEEAERKAKEEREGRAAARQQSQSHEQVAGIDASQDDVSSHDVSRQIGLGI